MLLVVVALVAVLAGSTAATADPSIASKRAEAQVVLAKIREIDSELARAAEAYNYANIELQRIDDDLHSNARHLVVARSSLQAANAHVADRLRTLYVNGDSGGVIEVLLGSESLDDLLTRLDVAERVGAQDAKVLKDVQQFRREVEERRARLRQARASQAEIVAQRAAQRNAVEAQLAERQRLLATIKDEISRLEAAEARRQARLAAEARARLAAQQRALAAARRSASESTDVQTLSVGSSGTTFDDGLAALETAAAPPPDGSRASQVISVAMQFLGVPYRWGGMSPSGFDCSGLIAYSFAQIGVSLPHHAASQFGYGYPVSRSDLQPGDLVFFDGLGHMGMYIGGGSFIHAPHTGDVVKISSLSDSWYASTFVGARRVL